MQIEILAPAQGCVLPDIKWNYEELKSQLSQALEDYKGRVYTDDAITQAKKDRATLNKLADAIDGKRREMKALYLSPYEAFEAQAKELTAMVKARATEIDAQVKAYEDIRRQEKQAAILELYQAAIGNLEALVPYEKLHNPRWLNVSTSMKAIEEELAVVIGSVNSALASIDKLGMEPEMAMTIKGVYLRDLNLAAALAEKERIEAQRKAMEEYKAQAATKKRPQENVETPSPTRPSADTTEERIHTVTFRITVTESKLKALGEYMRANGIQPERV